MRVFVLIMMTMLFFSPSKIATASSQNDCAIWICLPGGFPSGCGGAHSAFKHRIKKGRSPLPALSSCTTGPNGERIDGRYELGREYFEPCEDSYVLREEYKDGRARGKCYSAVCAPSQFRAGDFSCQSYDALRRPKPSYVKMWVDGGYLGQYFYQSK